MTNWHGWMKRAISLLFIYGGITGVIKLAPVVKLFNNELFFLVFYICSVIAGVYLLEGTRSSVLWAKIIAFVQIPIILAPWVSYYVTSGYAAKVIVKWPTMQFVTEVGPKIRFLLSGVSPAQFGVNLVALGIFLYLLTYYRER